MFNNYNRWDDWNDEFDHPLEPLKPCPCCGGEAWLQDNGYEEPEIDSNGAYVGMDIHQPDIIWVECQSCGLQTSGAGTPEEVIAQWNQRQAPTIDPVKHGHWIDNGHDKPPTCSRCGGGALLNYESDYHKSDACPHCGAKMDEPEGPLPAQFPRKDETA